MLKSDEKPNLSTGNSALIRPLQPFQVASSPPRPRSVQCLLRFPRHNSLELQNPNKRKNHLSYQLFRVLQGSTFLEDKIVKHILQNKYAPIIALLLAMIIWSSSFIGLKIAFTAFHPMVVIFARMLIASLCFLALYKFTFKNFTYHKGDLKLLLFMSFCEPCLYFIFESIALKNTSASQAGVITATAPIFVLMVAPFYLNERYNLKAWLGAIGALVGVCWITLISSPDASAPNPILGNFCEIIAMICATGYTISLKKLSSRYSPLFLTASQSFIGALFYLPFLALPWVDIPSEFPNGPSLAVLYLGGCVTLGAYGLYNYALKNVPAARAASFINLIPFFAVFMAWIILGEQLSFYQIIASCLIVASVIYSQKHMMSSQ